MVKIIGYDLAKQKFQELEGKINGKYNKTDTVGRAYRDGSGRNIADTYLTRSEWKGSATRLNNLYTPRTISWGSRSDPTEYYDFDITWGVVTPSIVTNATLTLTIEAEGFNRKYQKWQTDKTTKSYSLSGSTVRSGSYRVNDFPLSFTYDTDSTRIISANARFSFSDGAVANLTYNPPK